MRKTAVQITWYSEMYEEKTTLRGGNEFEFYEAIATNGVMLFSNKHGIPEHLVNVEILVTYIRN